MISIETGFRNPYIEVQGIANTVAEMLSKIVGEQDPVMLAMLQKEIRIIREWIIRGRHPKKIIDRLQALFLKITEHQYSGVENAAEKLHKQAAELAKVVAPFEAKQLETFLKERNLRRGRIKYKLSDEQIRDMLTYKPFVDGKTIWQWFDKLKFDNASTIFNAVQKGVVDGMTLNSIMQVIQGRQTPYGWEPGILDRNRRSAETLARTTINAVANQSRLEMYQSNADVLDGVQWRAALDHRTCIICGAYDGKIWPPDKMYEVKVPPAHPNCRCRLVPYIDIGEGVGRPAEAENFDQMAKEKYEAKYKGKKYDDLSYDYRRKLRYDAIKEYQKNGGEPYKRMESSTTFADYLKGQSEEFQQEWLGPGRYKLYKDGKLPLEYMVKPDNGFKRTIEDLKNLKREFISDNAERDGWSNSFWKKVDSIRDYNALKDIVVPLEMEQAIRKHGFRNVDDFVKKINEYVESNDVLHRVRLRDILQHLADEPILKNQFETGTTNSGFLSPEGRRKLERVISGGKSDDMMHRERPVYGYVGNVKRHVFYIEDYGDSTIVFKDSVRDRMTFTLGNSSSEQGAFCNDVRAIFNTDRETKLHGGFMELASDIIKGGEAGHTSQWYLESQIWGSADLRQDVSEIAIGTEDLKHLTNNVKLETWQRFKKQMDSAGVRVTRYVDLNAEKIRNNPDDWNRLQAEMKTLGIELINIAK